MDQKIVGAFLQSLRKEKGLTQKELADRICVSDKTISKWENGNSMPDTSMLVDLCRELDISINELLSAERIPPEEYTEKAEVTIMNLMKENQENKKSDKIRYIIGTVFLMITIALTGIGIGTNIAWYIDIPSFLLLACGCAAVSLLSNIHPGRSAVISVLRKSVIPIGTLIASVSLIAMIHRTDAPEKIGPNIAVSLLAVVYALIAYFILFLLEQHRK
ncbi:MAG: helix-turn-helix domain-containing protein [Lachnospiraceae bacterium]|nr:helix-turn-helix domain-containing protein [Lachnospiraceae bacterium]